VTTTDPRYTKRLLLHVTEEPEVRARPVRSPDVGIDEFEGPGEAVVTDGPGRMFVRTVLPEKRIIRRIGGVAVKAAGASAGDKGDGKLKDLKVLFGACTETIHVKCVEGGPAAKFEVTSSVFGKIGAAEAGKRCTDDPRHPQYPRLKLDPHLSFTIEPGTKAFEAGDSFTIDLVSHRFWVGGENPEPTLAFWTYLGHVEGQLASRRMGGWGRLEIEPAEPAREDRFLTVLHCTGSGTATMPGTCERIRPEDGGAGDGVRLSQGDRAYEVRFDLEGRPGGRISIVDKGNVIIDRAFAGTVVKEFKPAP